MANFIKETKNKENTPVKKPSTNKKSPVKKPPTKKNSPLKKIDEEKVEVKPEIIKRRLYTDSDRKDGAKSKIDSLSADIIERTRKGLSKKDRIAGLIHHSTYKEWLDAGEQDIIAGNHTQFSEFSKKIAEAEREFRDGLLECVKKHAPDDWRAATWLLERSDSENYKLKDKVDLVSNGETVSVPFYLPIKKTDDQEE